MNTKVKLMIVDLLAICVAILVAIEFISYLCKHIAISCV